MAFGGLVYVLRGQNLHPRAQNSIWLEGVLNTALALSVYKWHMAKSVNTAYGSNTIVLMWIVLRVISNLDTQVLQDIFSLL